MKMVIFKYWFIFSLMLMPIISTSGNLDFDRNAMIDLLRRTTIRCWVHADIASYAAAMSKQNLNRINIDSSKLPQTEIDYYSKYGAMNMDNKSILYRVFEKIHERTEVSDPLPQLAEDSEAVYQQFKIDFLKNNNLTDEYNVESIMCIFMIDALKPKGKDFSFSDIEDAFDNAKNKVNNLMKSGQNVFQTIPAIAIGNHFGSAYWKSFGFTTGLDNLRANKYVKE